MMNNRKFNALFLITILAVFLLAASASASDVPPMLVSSVHAGDVALLTQNAVADIYVDPHDAAVTHIAARLLSEDLERVTSRKPLVKADPSALGRSAILIGTIGKSAVIDGLIAAGKLDVTNVSGKWEASVLTTIDHPLPDVDQALVIAGSDRRGTAFGVFELSEQIGVSPWYWWADVKPKHQENLIVKAGRYVIGEPAVKYRGIFINDEDWGIRPWASTTFDPKFGNIGPRTYEKVFELLLRLKANYLWPAMHPAAPKEKAEKATREFGTVEENIRLADDWAIVMGASHAEPMNRDNVAWNEKTQGPWRYDTNQEAIYKFWQEWARKRGPFEATWTIGLRGIHDSPMEGPKDIPGRVKLAEKAIDDQRKLLEAYVNPKIDQVPQIFCPYKEVLTLYQNGLKVPDDVTLVWPDDNHGYIRQLSSPEENKRSGGSGVYYHLSYWGQPEDYLWLCTTPPALVWEEMSKAYDNDARRIWVVNVGDIKPAEIGMELFLKLARNPHAWDEHCHLNFLTDWATRNFGPDVAGQIASVMDEYYRLNFAVKPEHILAAHLSSESPSAGDRLKRFDSLVQKTDAIYAQIPPDLRDAFFETVVYPVRCSAAMNRKWLSGDPAAQQAAYDEIQLETSYYNQHLAGGKWKNMMSADSRNRPVYQQPQSRQSGNAVGWIGAASGDLSFEAERPNRQIAPVGFAWKTIAGLGISNDSIALLPTDKIDTNSARLEYDFSTAEAGAAKILVYCVPTHMIHAGLHVRYSVSIDGGLPNVVDLETREFSPEWGENVLHGTAMGNSQQQITAGRHTLRVSPLDPGMVFDKIVINLSR
jgi:hypothetical protein